VEVHSRSQYFRYPVSAMLNNRSSQLCVSYGYSLLHLDCAHRVTYINTKYVSEAGCASFFRQEAPNLLDPLRSSYSRGSLIFLHHFPVIPADQFCSQEPSYTYRFFIGTQWLRIAWLKGSNRLVASCLMMEAQPAA